MSTENKKWIYSYGDGKAEGNATMRNLLGGKGVGLHDMSSIGLPVPPGFTITTEVCTYYYEHTHFYCECCQRTFCLKHIHVPVVQLPDGFTLRNINYVIKGLCPECTEKSRRG